jgi:hypothetical protein
VGIRGFQTLHQSIVYTLCYTHDIENMMYRKGDVDVKLRLLPVLLTVFFSAVVFFGGWFLYQSIAVESPMNEIVQDIPGVVGGQIELDRKTAVVSLKLERDANLRSIYSTILDKSKSVAGNRQVEVLIESTGSSDILEQWWSLALFDVAQAMETRNYGDIPVKLGQYAADSEYAIEVITEMDEMNVYVRLTEGENSKFIVLPRTPAQMGVWTDESI